MKRLFAGCTVMVCAAALVGGQAVAPARGVALSELAWPEAEPWLTPSTVVVIPLGSGALEQGRHMKLDSDERLARYLASRVKASSSVVIAPSLNYHFYPAYGDYPGSTTLSENAARDVTVEAVRSLARFGPRRFYVLNTSGATLGPLSAAAKTLGDAGILLGYTDPDYWIRSSPVLKQSKILVSHADEAATSMMLFVDPAAVDMSKASREYAQGRGALTRVENGRGVLSTSGTLGDATLATAQKGETLVSALVNGILDDIDNVRKADLPAVRTAPPAPPPPAPAVRPAPRIEARMPSGCTAGDDRSIRAVGDKFQYNWTQQDAQAISLQFTPNGDIRHPDGSIERSREVILSNRVQLFGRREYRDSKHFLQLNDIRCLNEGVAIADGKWELRLHDDPQTTPGRGMVAAPVNNGWCTLVLVKNGDAWMIEAWRYTINPPVGAPPPVLLSKPGFTGRGGG